MNRRVIKPQRPSYGSRDKAPKPYRPTLTWARLKSVLTTAGTAALVVWFYSWFNITQIVVEGLKSLPPESVRTKTEHALSKGILGSNLLTLRPGKVTDELYAAEPLLKDIRLERSWPSRLKVVVIERQPSINWVSGNQTFLLDAEGTVIGPTSEVSLATVVDSANLPVKAGDRVAPRRFVEFVSTLGSMLAAAGVGVSGYRVPDTTSEVYAQTDMGYIIKFDTARSATEQMMDLKSVLTTLSGLKKSPAEYIDLRVPNKAYYR